MTDRKQNRVVTPCISTITYSFGTVVKYMQLVLRKPQSLERTLFHRNKFVLLANWRIITLRTEMKMFCRCPSQIFCHWLMELHKHCCEMESMMIFSSLSPFMPSSILFTVLLINLFFGFFGLSWWRRVLASMFLGTVSSYKLCISGFLDSLNMLRVVHNRLTGVVCIRW